MQDTAYKAIAIVGTGAILPDAPNVPAFWNNIKTGRDSVTEVPPNRWDPALYYDPDHKAPDKTYSKIGGWVREYPWEPFKWRMAIPPLVADAMDGTQRWGIACTREALADYGYPTRPLDTERTAVILGNAMGGEQHYLTSLRAYFPEYARELDECATFAALPASVRRDITREWHERMGGHLPPITEDSMPGELANCLAGRIANLFNLRGPNFTCDAACASAMAAIRAAAEGLIDHDFDAAITGGVDRNMGAPTFIKFCKIGALSATGSRPYAEGADGFVMGEGAAVFLMKRLEDAERDGDRIYAVIRGIGASSDGKGKGITAPNPAGQKIAVERAWQNAGFSPLTATLMEGHGTSTSVGDVVEVESIATVLKEQGANGHKIALGSVKSNFGHLKGGAGAASVLKVALALRDKVLPPSIHCEHPNPNIDFGHIPLVVNTELRPWNETADGVRRAGASAFGFGGTNFHIVMEEYIPHRITGNGKHSVSVSAPVATGPARPVVEEAAPQNPQAKAPLRGALLIGAPTPQALAERLKAIEREAAVGRAPAPAPPLASDLRQPYRLAIDYGNAAELADKSAKALKAFAADQPAFWKALQAQGVFRGQGPAPKVAFLYPGQGSQYLNMLRELRSADPIIRDVFVEADQAMTPLLGRPLSEFIFLEPAGEAAAAQAEDALRQTAITQPVVLTADIGITRLLAAYGIKPDMTMGHSLGEYGALVASGALAFPDALEAVSARGREMTRVSMQDNGRMAAVFAPVAEIRRILETIPGYVVIANLNSGSQAVIGGASQAVEQAMQAFLNAGYNAVPLPVSHAFHTSIVAPASGPLRQTLKRLQLREPHIPIVANVDGEFYPTGEGVVEKMLDILARQIASPVQFIKGLETLYDAGTRVFVEVGPKKALHGFVEDVLGPKGDVLALYTNHPKTGDLPSFNVALCGLYAAGLGAGQPDTVREHAAEREPAPPARPASRPVVITGAALGLPGSGSIFDDANVSRILNGEQFIDTIPTRFRRAMLDKHITRLVKSDLGGPSFETITDPGDLVKLAGRGGSFDLAAEFGISSERVAAMDRTTALAIAIGIDALRDAGIPLVMRYKNTSKGTQLPDRWVLPEALRDDTGILFASVFPGYDSLADEISRYDADRARREQLAMLESLRTRAAESNGHSSVMLEIDRRITELRAVIEKEAYSFDRRWIFRVLSMGHSQFAEMIGARGPNTQVNAACASTTQAVAVAEDWIASGRCRRVIIVAADDITSDHLIEWFGSGFLATGAAATDEVVEEAAVPFDRRRHGMIIGMGAAAMVVESAEAAAERGIRPICEVLSAVTANSAFHGTRLDPTHIAGIMESLVARAETRAATPRQELAKNMVFVSHETYTPARGGSASAEVHALRTVFDGGADSIVIANTKGFTGHAMGAGIEDVVAVKSLETGCVPPVANFKEVDPELGPLNLSHGGAYPVEYALRLGAGFGSQISMTLLRRVGGDATRPSPLDLGYRHRIADEGTWKAWLQTIGGDPADLEVVQRTLRIKDSHATAKPPVIAEPVELRLPAEPSAKPSANAGIPAPSVGREQPRAAEPVPPPTAPAVAPAPVAAAPAAATASPALPHASSGESVEAKVLAIVAEKTGYPLEMLALDLDLEADLGIDTVKQAEMFAAVRAAFGIPRDPNMKLRDFPTLGHVIRFAQTGSAPEAAPATPVPAKPSAETPVAEKPAKVSAAPTAIRDKVLALVSEKTGYPIEMLDPDLDLEADLGIDTVKQAEVFAAVREAFGIPRDPNMKLRDFPTLGHVIRFAQTGSAPEAAPATPVAAKPSEETPAAEKPAKESVAPAAVREKVLALVSEKTGYPIEMLDPDLDLEADLGVDTVKQAEVFAAVREAFGIPRDPNMKLRDFPTLGHVIRFAEERRNGGGERPAEVPPAAAPAANPPEPAAAAATPSAPAAVSATATPSADSIHSRVLAIVAEKTGYPIEMLDPDLDLEADLGVDTVKQAEVFAAVRAAFDIPRDPNLKLRDFPTLGHVMRFAEERRNGGGERRAEAPSAAASSAAAPAAVSARPVAAGPATPSAPEAPSAAVALSATVAPSADSVREKVLAIVAEKTGYPVEMLDPDLDLEADLGIDTVKQAEMFAAVRAAFGIPRDPNMKLRDFPTLGHVIRFANQGAASSQSAAQPSAAAEPPAQPLSAPAPAPDERIFADTPRRVPVPVPRPPLTICTETGFSLGPGHRVLVAADQGGAGDALAARLRALGVEVLTTPDDRPLDGIYWLPALDAEGNLDTIAAFREAIQSRLKSLYALMRERYEQIATPGTFLISATRLGGLHGYGNTAASNPLGGAVTGFTKAYKRERGGALVKAVDFEPAASPVEIAELLIEETLRDPGAVEIGYFARQRWSIGLEERPAADGNPGLVLDRKTVFLVTGAAGSIVSAITADLAAASGGIFHLLDLVPEPDPANRDLERFVTDKDGLKRDLFARIQARGERATPVLVEKELAAIERGRAAWDAIAAVRAAGGTAHYYSVNLTDAEAVANVVRQILSRSGRVDVLLHAAGIERSHFLPAKDAREFDLVFDVKAEGWFNLLQALADTPLKATVAFSSVAGRFGNGGQADYSAANDLLCKIASSFRATRPETRAIAIDWTAWAGIGMASRGSIPKMMEMAGIDMLPAETGIPWIRRELTAGGTRGEVVVARQLGILGKEWDETGGVNLHAPLPGPMLGRIAKFDSAGRITIETTLDPAVQPFLYDHQIDGVPVLPGVMGIEAFAETARLLAPAWDIVSIEDVDFHAPFKFYRSEPRALTVEASFRLEDRELVADCRLIGSRTLPNQPEPQVTVHFTGRVRLAGYASSDRLPAAFVPAAPSGLLIESPDIYRVYFHGPAYQVVHRAWCGANQIVGEMTDGLPVNHQPSSEPLAASPRMIELCFQTAGLWEMHRQHRMGLPWRIERLNFYAPPESQQAPFCADVMPHSTGDAFDAEVIDKNGKRCLQLTGYRTAVLREDFDPAFARELEAAAV